MRERIQKDDYIGFTYAGKHSSQFGLKSVTSGDRYQRYLSPEFSDLTQSTVGRDGTLYFGTNKTKRTIALNVAFDDMTEKEYRELRRWLNSGIADLVLDEVPYVKYHAKASAPVQISFLVFMDENEDRVYKGEFQITFVCYDPYGYSTSKYLENYSYTGFIDKYQISAAQMSSTMSEWANQSKLLPLQTYKGILYDTFIREETVVTNEDGEESTNVQTCFYLYNPGDVDCDFVLELPNKGGDLTLELYEYDTEAEVGQLNAEPSYSLTFKDLPTSDTPIVIDTSKRLIYTTYNGIKTPINDCWQGGNYFQIPMNEDLGEYSQLKLICSNELTDEDTATIAYDYRFL